MTDVRLQGFAELLSSADETERNALFARAKLMAVNMADPQAFEAPITTLGDYLARDIPVPPILVEPAIVVRGGITCTIGRAGKGKTQFNVNRILKWACGRPLFPGIKTSDDRFVMAPSGPLKTLIIENEGAPGMFHQQITTMVNAPGYLGPKEKELVKENVLIWGDGGYSGLKLDDEAHLNMVRQGCEEWEPDIVFIEPFRGLWSGDENNSQDMAKVADALSAIATDFDCGVILTHHERKSGAGDDGEKMSAGRGSTVLEGVVATMENFEPAKGGDFREWSVSKLRYGGGVAVLPVRGEWQAKDFWYKHIPIEAKEQSIIDELLANDDPQTIKQISESLEEKPEGIRKILKDLVAAGKVKKMPGLNDRGGHSGDRYRVMTASTSGEPDELDF